MCIRNCYHATLVDALSSVPDTETVGCKLILSNMLILIDICSYYTSSTAFNEIALHNEISKTCSMNDYVISCGDFNHSSIDWNT